MATTLANTVLAISPHSFRTPKTRNRTPKETTVEMTDTIVYLKRCLASGVCRFCQRCSTRRSSVTGSVGLGHHATLAVTHP